jgi:hypothetical protein
MRNTLPVIAADTETLTQRSPHAHHGRKTPRLQRLSLLASGHGQTRQDVAQLLGVHRHTLGHWLALDEAGGLAAVLEVSLPAGEPASLPPDVLVGLEPALRQPAGVASDEALRQWVKPRDQLEVHYHTRYTIVRPRCHAQLKGPRPSPPKKA